MQIKRGEKSSTSWNQKSTISKLKNRRRGKKNNRGQEESLAEFGMRNLERSEARASKPARGISGRLTRKKPKHPFLTRLLDARGSRGFERAGVKFHVSIMRSLRQIARWQQNYF